MPSSSEVVGDQGNLGFARAVVAIWGILMIVLGFFVVTHPGISALIWVEIMGFGWLIGGIFDIVSAIFQRGRYWGWRIFTGIISILAGGYIVANPILGTVFTVQLAFTFIGVSGLLSGITNVAVAFQLESGKWSAIILGALQIIIGGWLLLHPIVGMLALVPVLGIFLIIGGIMVIVAAFRPIS